MPDLQELDLLLRKASEKKASDVHLKAGLPPVVRVNGNLYYLGDQSPESIERLTHAQMSKWANALMNPRQKEKYDAGEEVDLGYELQGAGRFRINICQQRGRPRLVCRLISDHIHTIDELQLPKSIKELAGAKRGLILVTGATGSGKSTTLAAIIDYIARSRSCHIVTIEDPIEFVFKDRKSVITQREVGLDTKTFSSALKYALRQDPDVILVGEMRDEETIMMALNAAETGHLVLSTLHTVDATETINRILGSVNPGIQAAVRMQLAAVMVGVASQRLVRKADGKGRVAAMELLIANQRVRDGILDPLRTADLKRVIEESANSGMQTFDQSLMELFSKQLINKEEALNNCTNRRDFQMRLEGVVSGDWRSKQNDEHSHSDQGMDIHSPLEKIQIDGLPSKKKAELSEIVEVSSKEIKKRKA